MKNFHNKLRKSVVLMLVLWLIFNASIFDSGKTSAQNQLPYKNPQLSIDERVKDLLSRMTLEEKAAQLICL